MAAHCPAQISELASLAKRAVEDGVPLVVAGGGDGTFSAIARYFIDSPTVLGVLPLGTGNAFARDLGIGPDIDQACRTIVGGRIAQVDVGLANGHAFLNVASVGLTARIAMALSGPMKRRFGRLVYGFAVIQGLARCRPFRARLETDAGTSEFETLLLVVGNGRRHAGPFLLSPTASIVDGRLTVYALATTRKSAFLRFALALATGRQGDLPEVETMSPTRGRLTTVPSKKVILDGEAATETPLEFRVAPRALHVVVPQEFDG